MVGKTALGAGLGGLAGAGVGALTGDRKSWLKRALIGGVIGAGAGGLGGGALSLGNTAIMSIPERAARSMADAGTLQEAFKNNK